MYKVESECTSGRLDRVSYEVYIGCLGWLVKDNSVFSVNHKDGGNGTAALFPFYLWPPLQAEMDNFGVVK